MAILWGKELIFIYNNAYSVIAADRHPNAMGRSTREIWPEVWDFNRPIFEKVMQEGKTVHLEDQLFKIRRQGEMVDAHFTLSYSPIWLDHDRVGGTLVTIIETTGRKQAESQLWKSKTKLEAAIANSTDSIFISDIEGNFIHYNDAFVSYHKFKNREECSRMIYECYDYLEAYFSDGTLAPNDMWAIPRALRGEQVSYTEYLLRNKKSGEKWWGRYSFGPFRDEEGKIAGCVVVCRDITDRKQEELALKESEKKYRSLFEHMSQGVFLQRADGKLIDGNPAALKMFGLTRDEFLGRTSVHPEWDVIREDGSPFPRPEHPSMVALRTGEAVKGVIAGVFNPQSQSRIWMEINAVPEFIPGEIKPHQVMVTLHDITERKQAVEALRENEERYLAIIEDQTELICRSLLDGTIIFFNQAYCRYFGKKDDEIIGTNFMPFIVEEDRSKVQEQIASLAPENTIVSYEERVILPNGEIRHQHWINHLILNEQGKPLEIQGVGRDITERKQAEVALLDAKRFSESLIVSMLDGLSVLDGEGVHIDVNPAFCHMTGFSRKELIGVGPPHPYWPPEAYEEVENAFQKTKQGNFSDFELTFMRKNGERFPVIVSPSCVEDEEGNIISYFATVKDISERVQIRDEIIRVSNEWQTTFDSTQSAIWILDQSQKVVRSNKTAELFFKQPKDQMVGRHCWEIVHGTEQRNVSMKMRHRYE